MAKMHLHFNSVLIHYQSQPLPLFEPVTATAPGGWTVIAGANGCGKSSLLRVACGLQKPQAGTVSLPGRAIYCEQRTDEPPPDVTDFLYAGDAHASRLRSHLNICPDWADRWSSLSHGERKRVQLAYALWREPAVLAVDEPTNHLDRTAADLLGRALEGFPGIGLLVTHDRKLADTLAVQTLYIQDGRVTVFAGGVTAAIARREQEDDAARRRYTQTREQLQHARQVAAARSGKARAADRKRSKRYLARGDSDGRFKNNVARLTGKDAIAGKLQRQMFGRIRQLEDQLDAMSVSQKPRVDGISVDGERLRSDRLVELESGVLTPGSGYRVHLPPLDVRPGARVGVYGDNATGKSTLVRHIVQILDSQGANLLFIPQELTREEADAWREALHLLPQEHLGEVMSAVKRLGSDPEKVLATGELSPGELRKLQIAMGITRAPAVIVMDEPTNHLDLPAIIALEHALETYTGTLLLVSHDTSFLDALVEEYWHISRDRFGHGNLVTWKRT